MITISANVPAYAMFATGKIRWKRTTGKYGCSEEAKRLNETAYTLLA